jgi:trk system potassium uptake protein TrkH
MPVESDVLHLQRRPPSAFASAAVLAAYLVLVVVAMVMMRSPRAMPAGSELSVPRTVFTVANAASLTGFQQTIAVESYKPLGQWLMLALIVAGSLVSMIVGTAGVARLLRLPYSMTRIILWAVGVELIAVAVGTGMLVGRDRDGFQAAFQAASAFGNAGVVVGAVSGMHDEIVHLLILPLAIVGGIGLPVLMELFDWLVRDRRPSNHTRAALVMTAAVYVVGVVAIMLLRWPDEIPKTSTLGGELRPIVVSASTAALNSRTLGWPVESAAQWPRAVIWVVMLLMLLGASPAGTGGGVKTTTLLEIGRSTWRILRGQPVSRVFGFAIVWVGLYLLVVLLTMMRLVSTEPQLSADQLLFTAVSAVSNVGLAYAPISITGDGLYTLSASMMLGRILPLVVLWWAAVTVRDADVAVG